MQDGLEPLSHISVNVLGATPSFEPYAYQTAVAEALLSGRRVVLRAPSGSGKSFAAWSPWITSRIHPYDFPPKMMHVLPGGAFFTQLSRKLKNALPPERHLTLGIQTEGDALDPFMLSDAVITTVDELLSMALHHPLGLHPGLSNINAGVLLGSYLVFDEFPALAFPETLNIWLGLLRRYYPFTPCIFNTAVLPRPVTERIAEVLDATYIDAAEFSVGGRRTWTQSRPLAPEAILRRHRRRTIVVCNTVRGAQMLYRSLARAQEQAHHGCELLLLHQYQLNKDRQPIEERVAEAFRPGGNDHVLLVTTSGIKVASDISAEMLITDPAPPDVLLRRAGRCARFAGEEGEVIVARVTDPRPGEGYPAPPPERLLQLLEDGVTKSSAEELSALDAVWESAAPEEQPAVLRDMPADAEIDASTTELVSGVREFPARLFSRVGACLHRVPETVQDPFELERFSLAVSSLERGWRQWMAGSCPGEWFALIPQWPAAGQQMPSWSLVDDPREFSAAARLIVLNSEAVSYDPIIGLELSPGIAYQSNRIPAQHTTWVPFDQHKLSYRAHAARTLATLERLFPRYKHVLLHLGLHWRRPAFELEQWLRLCVLWHDAGKLTADWQRAAHAWQHERENREGNDEVLARIDYRYERGRAFPCPEHAAQTGLALSRGLAMLLEPHSALFTGTIAALCHHHGLVPIGGEDLTPHPHAWETLLDLAAQVLDERQIKRLDRIGWTLHPRGLPPVAPVPPADPDAWMAYSLLSRVIRLADRETALASMGE